MKAFRNLLAGEDSELQAAYEHFHKMVEQEQDAVRNATLVGVGSLQCTVRDVQSRLNGKDTSYSLLDTKIQSVSYRARHRLHSL